MRRFRVHRCSGAASLRWAVLFVASGAEASGHNPAFDSVTDGSGGVIIVWEDSRYGERNIYAQRLDSLGVRQWPDTGVVICSAAGNQNSPVAGSDGAGGAVVAWIDGRGGADSDIYAQRFDGSGATLWAPNGAPVCTASDYQVEPDIAADESGGAIIVWNDYRAAGGQVFAQRVNASGAIRWQLDGVAASPLGGRGAQNLGDEIGRA